MVLPAALLARPGRLTSADWAARQVIMTKSYSGITIILLNRSYNTVIQTTNIVSNPSPWYWGSYGNGQQWIFGVRRPGNLTPAGSGW